MKDSQARPPAYIADLFEAERAAPPPARDVEDRVRARVAGTVIAASAVGAATTAMAATAATKGASATVLTAMTAKTSLVLLAVATVGATGAVAVHRHRVRAQEPAVVASRAAAPRRGPSPPPAELLAPPAAEAAAPTAEPEAPPSVAPVPLAVAPRPVRKATTAPTGEPEASPPGGLADENAFIEAARAALSARDPARAAALLAHHARLHPRGQMEEEREALWVQALAAAGDGAAARARADAFRRRFPRSIQLGVVSAALETIP